MNVFEAVVSLKESTAHTYSVIHNKAIHYQKRSK